jgi:hypothetical protein
MVDPYQRQEKKDRNNEKIISIKKDILDIGLLLFG